MSASDGACMHMCTTHKGMEKIKGGALFYKVEIRGKSQQCTN